MEFCKLVCRNFRHIGEEDTEYNTDDLIEYGKTTLLID